MSLYYSRATKRFDCGCVRGAPASIHRAIIARVKRNPAYQRCIVLTAAVVTLYGAGAWTVLYCRLHRALDRQLRADAANPMHAGAGVLVEIRTLDGEMLYRSPALGEGVIGGPVTPREGIGLSATSDRLHDGAPVRRLSRRADVAGKPAVIRVARGEAPIRRHLRDTAWALASLLPAALLLAAALARRLPFELDP